jgi:predicted kinase
MEQTIRIPLPTNTLVVLCGPAGAGKSSFAAQHFKPTQIVASDRCRALISDSESNFRIHRDTFDLFHFIIQKRLKLDRLTVADSTTLYAFARISLLKMAQQAGFSTCLIVFDVAFDICWQRAQQRTKSTPIDAISQECESLQYAKQDIQGEAWNQIYELGADVTRVRFVWQKRSVPSHQ